MSTCACGRASGIEHGVGVKYNIIAALTATGPLMACTWGFGNGIGLGNGFNAVTFTWWLRWR